MSALPIGHRHRTAASRMQGFGAGRPSHSQHRSRRQRAWTTNGSVQSGRNSPGPTSKPLTAGVTEAPALRTTLRTHRNLTSGPLASCWWDCVRERMTPVAMPKTRVPSSIGPVPLGLAAFGANDLPQPNLARDHRRMPTCWLSQGRIAPPSQTGHMSAPAKVERDPHRGPSAEICFRPFRSFEDAPNGSPRRSLRRANPVTNRPWRSRS